MDRDEFGSLLAGFGWFRVDSAGFGWFQVLSITVFQNSLNVTNPSYYSVYHFYNIVTMDASSTINLGLHMAGMVADLVGDIL